VKLEERVTALESADAPAPEVVIGNREKIIEILEAYPDLEAMTAEEVRAAYPDTTNYHEWTGPGGCTCWLTDAECALGVWWRLRAIARAEQEGGERS
jgi:hypothetical protein